ncbi:disintegrin and metalloproteinase domain-containing protein 5-like isoform X2 [Bos indicus]|uniref:Disintegrin and metalloproteinase domain-containing protein 5-like isoform X2 n=1 Tax=Bos indicus TaxID=9915 RepID=A0ABM4RPV3_BOSIN
MFLLLVLLTVLRGLHGGPNLHKKFVQTTIPEKISTSEAIKDPENNVAYVITIGGNPYFVHLTKQSFLSSASVVYFYDKNDIQHHQPLSAQMDCNYHGYVAGFPNSLVSLNICSGLRGTLQFKNISYALEPVESVSGFMHMIYEEKNDISAIPLLLENDTYSYERSQYKVRKSSERSGHTKLFPRYIDMYIVVDKNLFDYMGSDINIVTQKIIQIIGLVNTMFIQLKLTVRISSIEVWSDKNKISIEGPPHSVLYKFLTWKYEFTSQPHHIAYLFAFKENPTFIGVTVPGEICGKIAVGGVALYIEGLSLEAYAVSIVQLLGLNVGMSYDNTEICHCSGDVCTMSPEALQSGGVKDFSTCSLDDFKYFAAYTGIECLHKILPDEPVYKQRRVCGNGILETGEQCDCGTPQTCTHPDCCDARLCRKKKNKVCGSGACCTTSCQIKPVNTPCREAADECDFVEFCTGNESMCVPDTYARNGEPCASGDAFCYDGRCRSTNKHCSRLIGEGARGAPFACFDEINARGDRYGNCGRGFCLFSHTLCGKLVCAWPYKTLVSQPNLSVIYTHVQDEICASAFLNAEKLPRDTFTTVQKPEDRDETFVEDGTICGPEMYCLNFSCVEVKYQINTTICSNAVHCNSKGVCNNLNHCHCSMGFAPPNCKPLPEAFGSVDDGHQHKTGKSFLKERSLGHPKHRLQLVFYISIPVFIIAAALIIKQDKIRELCYKGELESERSVSEESSTNSKSSPSVSNSH